MWILQGERLCRHDFFVARQLVEKCREHDESLFVLFVDLKKAYDPVPKSALWCVLEKCGVPPVMLSVIRSFHDGMKAEVRAGIRTTGSIVVKNGLQQDCTLAPSLSNVYLSAADIAAADVKSVGVSETWYDQAQNWRAWQVVYRDGIETLVDQHCYGACAANRSTSSRAGSYLCLCGRSFRWHTHTHAAYVHTQRHIPTCTHAHTHVSMLTCMCTLTGVYTHTSTIVCMHTHTAHTHA